MSFFRRIVCPVLLVAFGAGAVHAGSRPSVVLVSIDTLRSDRLSGYGYDRPTSPNIDRVLDAGLRFEEARTVEPLTSPASCSMITSLYPHEHGSSRNGLRMREGLDSLPKRLSAHGWRTAAFVGNWTLRDKLSGLGEHFDDYREVLNRKRWWGLVRREADARDLTARALEWVGQHQRRNEGQPFFLWVHYTEPHAPYRFQTDFAEALGLDPDRKPEAEDRYDTEIAFVDDAVGRLLEGIDERLPAGERIVIVTSDHGESLGEHDYWGHGRHLYEPTLRIPLGISWPGTIEPRSFAAPALNVDIGPTLLGLLDLPSEPSFQGFDWSAVLDGAEEPADRVTWYQAHRGAVLTAHDSELARRSGLLAVAMLQGGYKEIVRLKGERRMIFDLREDPLELDEGEVSSSPTLDLRSWRDVVEASLGRLDDEPPEPLDAESIERLRALGYAD